MEKEYIKIKFNRAELNWIERTADMETTRIFMNFRDLLKLDFKDNKEAKELMDKQVLELINLYTFLKTLRSKLELWDCRYDIDTEIEMEDKKEQKKNDK